MKIGFSTGSLAKGNFELALRELRETSTNVVELSALREVELDHLIDSFDSLDLRQFEYVSFHAPARIEVYTEVQLIERLQLVRERGYKIIVHPDLISDRRNWRSLGDSLCIENMDKRKRIGRTANDLEQIFNDLPDAKFCLDVAHARQIDPTMTEAFKMIRNFGSKLAQIHLSDVNNNSVHEPLNFQALISYHRLIIELGQEIPIILESPVKFHKMNSEINLVKLLFNRYEFNRTTEYYGFNLDSSTGQLIKHIAGG